MRYIQNQTSFRAGQLDSLLEGRTDIKEYSQGCKRLSNMVILKSGGARKINGSSTVFSVSGSVGDNKYFKYSDPVTGNSQVLNIFTTAGSIVYAQLLDDKGTSIKLISLASNYGTGVSSANDFSFSQYEKWGILVHNSGEYRPTIFTIDPILGLVVSTPGSLGEFNDPWDFFGGVYTTPLESVLAKDISIVVSNAVNPLDVRLSLTGGAGIADYVSIGEILAIRGVFNISTETYFSRSYFVVNSVLGGNGVSCTAITTVEGYAAPRDGTHEVWYAPSFGFRNGWPTSVTTHETRLVYGGTKNKPMTVYGSASNNPFFFNNVRARYSSNISNDDDYSGEIQNTDPYVFTITATSGSGSKIKFLGSSAKLVVGLNTGITVGSGGDSSLLGPLAVLFDSIYEVPCDSEYVTINDEIYISAANSTQLHVINASESGRGAMSRDISILSSDLYEGLINSMAYNPIDKILAVVKKDGTMHFLTISKESEVLAHTEVLVGGGVEVKRVIFLNSSNSFLVFASTEGAAIPEDKILSFKFGDNAELDTLRFSGEKVQIDVPSPVAVLNIAEYSPNTNVIVHIYDANDELYSVQYKLTDVNRDVTLSPSIPLGAVKVIYGIPVNSFLQLMPIEAGQQWGSSQYGIKRIDSVIVRSHKSYSFKIKEESSNYWEEKILIDSDAVDPFTGPYEIKLSSTPAHEQSVIIKNDRAEPFTVLSVTLRGLSNDG